MKRTVTSEERDILLENPELVMFNLDKSFKIYFPSMVEAVIVTVIVIAVPLLIALRFPELVMKHSTLFVIVSVLFSTLMIGGIPLIYVGLYDLRLKNAQKNHYGKILKTLLPKTLTCDVAHVKSLTVEKGEGIWILDGKEQYFGYVGYVNLSPIEVDTDLAVIYNDSFFAFIKRDPKTESFYN